MERQYGSSKLVKPDNTFPCVTIEVYLPDLLNGILVSRSLIGFVVVAVVGLAGASSSNIDDNVWHDSQLTLLSSLVDERLNRSKASKVSDGSSWMVFDNVLLLII